MSKIKLTKKQNQVLDAMQKGHHVHYAPYCGRFNPSEYYDCDTVGRCTREIRKFIDLGLVEKCDETMRTHKVRLTEEGKAYKVEGVPQEQDWWRVDHWGEWKLKVVECRGTPVGQKKVRLAGESGTWVKSTNDHTFFETREEAYDYAINEARRRVTMNKNRVKEAELNLEKLEQER